MKKRMFLIVFLLIVSIACTGHAQDGAELLGLLLCPHNAQSLNMVRPFKPIEMSYADFHKEDQALLQALGFDSDEQTDIAVSGATMWKGYDDFGRQVVVVFCGSYGSYGFVFLCSSSGVEHLTDVLLDCYGEETAAAVITMANSYNYLLTEAWGHGSGTERWWTRWYNLDTRRMELSYLRRGTEQPYHTAATAVTVTSLDRELQRTIAPNDKQYLVTYTYTALVTYPDTQSGTITTGDAACTVRVYEATSSGMQLVNERAFAGVSPAVLQNLTVDALLNDSREIVP